MSSLGRIRKNLRNPVKLDPPLEDVINPMIAELIEEVRAETGATTKVSPHPMKYPQHADQEKGSVYAGICNRTACSDFPALIYNRGTYGYYCAPCGRAINGATRNRNPLCIEVDHDLTHEEMEASAREMYA
ncbi:hypothetical protein [Shinella zoogloeoides]|uniref:hypothetical protein n=1 Tax=Shinella zoogloeoides TaxID=352475 RepID=UPI00273EF7C0|nr:hypothetical protein [Shinella zoogloeoides]WLR90957.1 hypothetical protein Q9316_00845 [Shinella zoogloeoides]